MPVALSPYLHHLRSQIGTDLVLLPAVAVLVTDEGGRLLLVRQSDSGQWGTVGGAVEPGETPAEAGAREAMEETGLTVAVGRLVAALGGPDYYVTYPNGDQVSYVSIVFEATAVGGALQPDGEEVLEARWFAPAELQALDTTPLTGAMLWELGWIPGPQSD